MSSGLISRIKGKSLTPLKNGVIVSDMNFGERKLASGIILASDDGRWGRAFDLELEGQDTIRLWRADPEAILAVSDEEPKDYGDFNPEAV